VFLIFVFIVKFQKSPKGDPKKDCFTTLRCKENKNGCPEKRIFQLLVELIHTAFIASTGFSLDAARAGISPAIKPITLEIISPVKMFPAVKMMVNSVV
jgi:hypothetical protein